MKRNPWGPVLSVLGEPDSRSDAAGAGVVLRPSGGDIAIVGLGCVLPGGALDVTRWWHNLITGADAIRPVPDERWSSRLYHDPTGTHESQSVARRAGVVTGFSFDALRYRIPPRVLPTIDPSQQLALVAADQAVEMAGWRERDGQRAAVVLGNAMGGEYAKSLALRVRFREVIEALKADPVLKDVDFEALSTEAEARLAKGLPPILPESMGGLLANVVAGRVASWLDWMGGSLTVDAACAASLAAVQIGVDWLRSGRVDAVLTGGVDTDLSPETFVGFSRAEALSNGNSSPFSQEAAGFVMGEGAAVFALERLDDAVAAGRPVWAVISGVGQASDGQGRGITAPRPAGQRLAIQRAHDEAGFGAEAIGYVEAHGTGTPVGDAVELQVLREHFGERAAWVGSVKSNVGHLKSAAGAAGLLKAVLAVATGVIPPTLHAAPIHPELGPLKLPRRPAGFPGQPRRAAVSAFGFGGTNLHLLVSEPPEGPRPPLAEALTRFARPLVHADAAWRSDDAPPPLLLCFAGVDEAAVREAVRADAPVPPDAAVTEPCRLVMVCAPARRQEHLDGALRWLEAGRPGRAPGLFYGEGPAVPAVLLFPGQGTQRPGTIASVQRLEPAARALHAWAVPDEGSAEPEDVHAALFTAWIGWTAALEGLPVAARLGHSLGELGALLSVGALTPKAGLELARVRGAALQACPAGAMLALRASGEVVEELARRRGLAIAAANAPDSYVLSGDVRAVAAELRTAGVPHRALEVARAYHSEAVAPAAKALEAAMADVDIAGFEGVWSASRAAPLEDPHELVEAMTRTVRFRASLEALWKAGHTLFVEVGPGRTLTGLVNRTLPDAVVVPLDAEPATPRSLVSGIAALVAAGHDHLVPQLGAPWVRLDAPPMQAAPAQADPEPARAAEPAAQQSVQDRVVAAVADVSGYPPDFLLKMGPDAQLEADLGIDSIRKMEILGQLEDELGFRTPRDEYVRLANIDLQGLVHHVEAALASGRLPEPGEAATLQRRVWAGHPAASSQGAPVPDGFRGDGVWSCPAGSSAEDVVAAWMQRAREPRPDRLVVVAPHGDVAGAAGVGFARSLALEWGVPLRVIETMPGVSGAQIAGEVAADGRPPLLRLMPDGAQVPQWQQVAGSDTPLPHQPVVLATGGATGIVLPCLEALASLQPRVLVVGRRPRDERDEALASLPFEADYAVCDLTDEGAVDATLGALRGRWGPVDIVVHGAGTLRDGAAESRTPGDARAVLGPKLAAETLGRLTPEAKLWVSFSSVAAVFGNPGQTLYSAANNALAAWRHPTARTVALDWTAWSEVGMAADPEQQRLLARQIRPVTPAEGAALFREALSADGRLLVV